MSDKSRELYETARYAEREDIAALLDAGADPTIRDKKKRLAEDRIGTPEEYIDKYESDSYDPNARERIVSAREARELAAVAGEGKAEGTGRRRRI